MRLKFPKGFLWGTSTAAAQIETASEHNWKGIPSIDGYTFNETTEHEKRRMEDLTYIKQFGSVYRCGVDWARLQTKAFAPFEKEVIAEYQEFFQKLNEEGMQIMFVIHHFTNPLWFENNGSWQNADNIPAFVDYAKKCIKHFSKYVFNWNTFNEPNVYAMNAWMLGGFPPQKYNYFKANRAIKHLSQAHNIVYDLLKEATPDKPVGISLNTVWFKAHNFLGYIPAKLCDWWFHWRTAKLFEKVDYWGVSYYAYILLNPFPITEIDKPGKLDKMGLPHDDMWAYKPEGLGKHIRAIYKRYKKPIIITENGICTEDSQKRIASIKDYLKICHELIEEGIPLKGYIHWSAWDNFEWNLGPTFRFGLVRIDLKTKDRTMTEAGVFYSKVTSENAITID